MRHKLKTLVIWIVTLVAVTSGYIHAAGAPAGTKITNRAFADYKDANGNALARVFSNTVETTVTQVAGVSVDPANESLAGANETTVYFPVEINNTGNGSDTFNFTYSKTSGWEPTSVSFYYDVNDNDVYDAGTDTLIGTGAGPHSTTAIDADDHYPIIIAVSVPAVGVAPDASSSTISLTATSQLDGTVTDSGSYTATVAAAVISAQKTHSPASPKPGDTITYTITLTNTGSVDGTTTVVNDPIPTGMTYLAGSITLGGSSKTDQGGDDEADYGVTTPNNITISAGTIAAGGGSTIITFQVKVNEGIAAGTEIFNQATVKYDSGGNQITENTNSDSLTVSSKAGVDATPGTTTEVGDPRDVVTFPISVKNDGNADDTIDLTYTSTLGVDWEFWYDANNDGIPGNDGDYKLTDTDGDGKIDTGNLSAGSTAPILASVTIPAGTSDGTTDTLVVTATSTQDDTVSDTSGNLVTTVTAPVLQISKTVDKATAKPGEELTYTVTVTNTGSGTATTVVVTDVQPAFTTYKTGSIKTGSSLGTLTGRTDASDGDGAEFDDTSKSVIAGNNGTTLGSGGTFVVQFIVTVNE